MVQCGARTNGGRDVVLVYNVSTSWILENNTVNAFYGEQSKHIGHLL
jgi:hypothetical protein